MANTPTLQEWVVDTAERAGVTLIQSMVVFLPALLGPWNADVGKSILAACFPAVGSVIVNAFAAFFPQPKSFAIDMVWRVIRTFVVTAGGAATAAGFDLFNGAAWKVLALSGAMAVFAVIKAEIAKLKVGTVTPASLAPLPEPPRGPGGDDRGEINVATLFYALGVIIMVVFCILWLVSRNE